MKYSAEIEIRTIDGGLVLGTVRADDAEGGLTPEELAMKASDVVLRSGLRLEDVSYRPLDDGAVPRENWWQGR